MKTGMDRNTKNTTPKSKNSPSAGRREIEKSKGKSPPTTRCGHNHALLRPGETSCGGEIVGGEVTGLRGGTIAERATVVGGRKDGEKEWVGKPIGGVPGLPAITGAGLARLATVEDGLLFERGRLRWPPVAVATFTEQQPSPKSCGPVSEQVGFFFLADLWSSRVALRVAAPGCYQSLARPPPLAGRP